MGGEYRSEPFDQCTEKELRKKVQSSTDEQVYEDGHGPYSGTWGEKSGLEILNKTFNSYQEASDYVCDHNDKWGPLSAVKYIKQEKVPNKNQKKIDALNESIAGVEIFLDIGFHHQKQNLQSQREIIQIGRAHV